jgi:hypothetical protein
MTEYDPYYPVARLVPRSCAIEQVGDDVVTLDEERLQYHSMHEQVFQVLRASDGSRSVDEIAALVFGRSGEPQVDLTNQALLDLMDAELIADDTAARERFFSRRAVGKAAAALLLGAVGLPLVKSISAPDAASAVTRCGSKPIGAGCTTSDTDGCLSCCCCAAATQGICQTEEFCSQFSASGYSCM